MALNFSIKPLARGRARHISRGTQRERHTRAFCEHVARACTRYCGHVSVKYISPEPPLNPPPLPHSTFGWGSFGQFFIRILFFF